MNSKIKWGFIQPLTGGLYIGARNAIGHDAEWIISFPGFRGKQVKKHKDGTETEIVANESNLYAWLEKQQHDANYFVPPYYIFDRQAFDTNLQDINNTKILDYVSHEDTNVDYSNMDLVIALPVCSGLSRITTSKTTAETRESKNCNQLFITKYTLSVIKPKMFIYENAPGLYSNVGTELRQQLEEIALKYHYSILYYKTDTMYHGNPQKRPRTFVIFQQWNADKPQLPNKFGWERKDVILVDYLKEIPENATQEIPIPMSHFNRALIDYAKHLYGGENWREKSYRDLMSNFTIKGDYDKFKDFLINNCSSYITEKEYKSFFHFLDHVKYKLSLGKGYYSCSAYLGPNDKVGSIQFKSLQSYLNPTHDRHYTIREALHLMGMPHDFELQGTPEANFPKIGQNVPVKTGQFIVSQVVDILNNWYNEERIAERTLGENILKMDNTHQRIDK